MLHRGRADSLRWAFSLQEALRGRKPLLHPPAWIVTMKDVLSNLGISEYELARTCGEFHVRTLSAIGKGIRTDAEGQQVIDLLVEFGATPSPGVPLLAHNAREAGGHDRLPGQPAPRAPS